MKGWEEVGDGLYLKKGRGFVLIRRGDGAQGSMPFTEFDALLSYVDTACGACKKGKLEYIDFADVNELRLVCNICEAVYLLVEGGIILARSVKPTAYA